MNINVPMRKKAIIKVSDDVEVERHPDPQSMSQHVLVSAVRLEISDGYHTMDELYDHRIRLYIALCKSFATMNYVVQSEVKQVWRSQKHSDGTGYDGWFILGINKEKGGQITYHLPMSEWENTEFAETLETAPEWDKHTSADVLNRIKAL